LTDLTVTLLSAEPLPAGNSMAGVPKLTKTPPEIAVTVTAWDREPLVAVIVTVKLPSCSCKG